MAPVAELFGGLARPRVLAKALRVPEQTVYAWKRKGAIPVWRRPAVLAAIQRLGWDVPTDVIVYLAKGA